MDVRAQVRVRVLDGAPALRLLVGDLVVPAVEPRLGEARHGDEVRVPVVLVGRAVVVDIAEALLVEQKKESRRADFVTVDIALGSSIQVVFTGPCPMI